MGGNQVIVVQDLTARFGQTTVLEKVSLTVDQGEVVVIAGGSGCGKSTLLKHLIGLYRPHAGRIWINQVEITSPDLRNLDLVRPQIGVLFQSGALLGSMTLAENVVLPMRDFLGLGRNSAELMARMKLSLVNLSGYENHLPSEVSGGMLKRAGLARAMALDPSILFFDEPSAGLDPITSAELDLLIKRINQGLGTTMVIVTHELDSIMNIAHRVIMLDKSARGIIAQGSPQRLKERSRDPLVSNFFHRRVGNAGGAKP